MKTKLKKYNVIVTWEAIAQVQVRAESEDAAMDKVSARGLLWRRAEEGDTDHHYIEAQEIEPQKDKP